MFTITEAFSQIKSVKVLVIGDFLLDVYTVGKVERISPEAPVPVLLVSEITQSPGGAGNVALNLAALGAKVGVVGRVEKDDILKSLLDSEGIDTNGFFIQEGYKTPLKNRFLADGQQLMRSDYESQIPLSDHVEKDVFNFLKNQISEYDIIAVSDYGKGFLTKTLLKLILDEGHKQGIKVIIDPKGSDFTKYNGAYLIKPNNKEAYAAAKCDNHISIEEVADRILNEVDAEHLLITRSDKGMALFSKNKEAVQSFAAVKKDVIDVTGAGDTALAMITFGLGNGLCFENTITLANIASSLAIERVGCAAIRFNEVMGRLLEKEPMSKIFWEDSNLFVLERALDSEETVILDLRGSEDITTEIYHLIKAEAHKKNGAKLIVHVTPTINNKNFIHLLASMHEVDFVFARSGDPKLCSSLIALSY